MMNVMILYSTFTNEWSRFSASSASQSATDIWDNDYDKCKVQKERKINKYIDSRNMKMYSLTAERQWGKMSMQEKVTVL